MAIQPERVPGTPNRARAAFALVSWFFRDAAVSAAAFAQFGSLFSMCTGGAACIALHRPAIGEPPRVAR